MALNELTKGENEMNYTDIDELNDAIENFIKGELNCANFDYRIDDENGNCWVTIGGKTYSMNMRFNECPF